MSELFDELFKTFSIKIAQANEMTICEVLAWRMYGVNANWYYLQGEFELRDTVRYPLDK
jgi:hypothetical protein